MKSNFKIVIAISIGLISYSCSDDESLKLNESQTSQTSVSKNKTINSKTITVIDEGNFEEFISPVENEFINNIDFVDEFIQKSDNGTLQKADFVEMLDILGITPSTDVSALESANQSSGVYNEMLQRQNEPDFPNYNPNPSLSRCDRLVKIRDAMLTECDAYVWGLDEICSGAVMVAYWYKSDDC